MAHPPFKVIVPLERHVGARLINQVQQLSLYLWLVDFLDSLGADDLQNLVALYFGNGRQTGLSAYLCKFL